MLLLLSLHLLLHCPPLFGLLVTDLLIQLHSILFLFLDWGWGWWTMLEHIRWLEMRDEKNEERRRGRKGRSRRRRMERSKEGGRGGGGVGVGGGGGGGGGGYRFLYLVSTWLLMWVQLYFKLTWNFEFWWPWLNSCSCKDQKCSEYYHYHEISLL